MFLSILMLVFSSSNLHSASALFHDELLEKAKKYAAIEWYVHPYLALYDFALKAAISKTIIGFLDFLHLPPETALKQDDPTEHEEENLQSFIWHRSDILAFNWTPYIVWNFLKKSPQMVPLV